MNDINDFFKKLQQTTERLNSLKFEQSNPWQSIHEMQQLFNHDFWANIGKLVQQPPPQNATTNNTTTTTNTTPVASIIKDQPSHKKPAIDLYETVGKVVVCFELPGLDRNSVKITVTKGKRLTILGNIKEHRLLEYKKSKERFTGKFNRTIELPSQVSPKPIQTTYTDGILEIALAKKRKKS